MTSSQQFRAQVLPLGPSEDRARIDCAVYAPDVAFSEGADHVRHAKLELVAVAWDRNNAAVGNVSQTMELALKPASYQAVLQSGLSAHMELELKPGNYTLRLGVMDDSSGKIGVLNAPLVVADRALKTR